MTQTQQPPPRMLGAREAAALASQIAGFPISETTVRTAGWRARDAANRGGQSWFAPIEGPQGQRWPEPAVRAWSAGKREPTAEEIEAAHEFGREQGLLTEKQAASAAGISVAALRVATTAKTRSNPAPDPLSPSEIEARIPLSLRRWKWFDTARIQHWIQNKRGRGNHEPKRISDAQLRPDDWTARHCAAALGITVDRWYRLVRTEVDAPQPTHTIGKTRVWHRPTVQAYKTALEAANPPGDTP